MKPGEETTIPYLFFFDYFWPSRPGRSRLVLVARKKEKKKKKSVPNPWLCARRLLGLEGWMDECTGRYKTDPFCVCVNQWSAPLYHHRLVIAFLLAWLLPRFFLQGTFFCRGREGWLCTTIGTESNLYGLQYSCNYSTVVSATSAQKCLDRRRTRLRGGRRRGWWGGGGCAHPERPRIIVLKKQLSPKEGVVNPTRRRM